MLILAFESSCDETAVAVVRDGRTVLSDAILSQVDVHALYGGVVPEIASRKHVEAIAALTDRALAEAGAGADPTGDAGGSSCCPASCPAKSRCPRLLDSRRLRPGWPG